MIQQALPRATVTSTRDVISYSSYFSITATYDIISSKVSTIRNAKFNYKNGALVTNTYVLNLSSPRYGYFNGGRDASVTYTGDLHFNSLIGHKNVTFYSEFTAY